MSGFKVIRTPEEAHKHAEDELLTRMNNVRPIKGKKVTYHVTPRFTPGSPAMVDFGIAKRVAFQESQSHHRGMRDNDERAAALGLQGIAYAMDERAECWIVTDLITNHVYIRMFDKQWKTPSAQLVHAGTLMRKYGIDDVRDYDGDKLT